MSCSSTGSSGESIRSTASFCPQTLSTFGPTGLQVLGCGEQRPVRAMTSTERNVLKLALGNIIRHVLDKKCLKVKEAKDAPLRSGMNELFEILDLPPILDWLVYEVELNTNPPRSKDTMDQYLHRSAAVLACFLLYLDDRLYQQTLLLTFRRCYWDIVKEYESYQAEDRKDKVRSFRQRHIPHRDLLCDVYGFNVARVGIPGSWNTQQKEQVFYIAGILRWINLFDRQSRIYNLILAVLYIVGALGENLPNALDWVQQILSIAEY
jgi:hypothetical protein